MTGEQRQAREMLVSEIAKSRKAAIPKKRIGTTVVAAFYVPWQATGLPSLRANASKISHVVPAWLHLTADGSGLDFEDYDLSSNPGNAEVITLARANGVRIVPLLSNSNDDVFDGERVHRLLTTPGAADKLIHSVVTWLVANRFDGLNIDFENLSDADTAKLPAFLARLGEQLHANGLTLSIDLEAGYDAAVLGSLAEPVDWALVMAYDQHASDDRAGPIAGIDWTEKVLDKAAQTIPEDKLVVGIGAYAYDWVRGRPGAEALTYQEAIAAAAGYRDEDRPDEVMDFDAKSLNSHFEYEDGTSRLHDVWILDAASAYNQLQDAKDRDLRGIGIWCLGSEDPSMWRLLDRNLRLDQDPRSIEEVKIPYDVSDVGKGEVLTIERQPEVGRRTLEIDPQSKLIVDQTYQSYPSPYVVRHSGYVPKKLVLTFDDGPDPTYTAAILAELRRLHVPAAFFFIGKNVESYPDLVRQTLDDGHEIGSHTFTHPNLGSVSPLRAELELNATQRALEGILGRSTILFRPPFNADAQPGSMEEILPVEQANQLGYITIGEKIDPEDWNLTVHDSQHGTRSKTASDITKSVIDDVLRSSRQKVEGNVILLHDAGGDRSQTVAAIAPIVEGLRARGYEFVSIGDLIGRSEDELMPPIAASERFKIALARVVFSAGFSGSYMLAIAFLAAIALGLARILLILPLALIHRARQARMAYAAGYQPSVSILIAAYNEENTVCATVRSVLGSAYPVSEVIVVDDGSTDGSLSALQAGFAADERVKVLTQSNGGKASALNHALEESSGELLICIDADTQLDPGAVGALTRHFADPRIAAVAGNVRVGNAENMITQWQSVEYTTSQNLDREAYALLNAVTVVPGAIGAWRKSAVSEVGGYISDTLAEDMDLSWRLRRAGYRLETDHSALAFTEAPDNLRSLLKQRFRWAYGSLQCLWKHRGALGRHGFFGAVILPLQWLLQVLFQCLAPLIDLQLLYSLVSFGIAWNASRGGSSEMTGYDAALASLEQAAFLYALFFVVELVSGLVAYGLERRSPAPLAWLFLQRFVYRQVLYVVIVRAIARALSGSRQGWGKLHRKGTVQMPSGS
jgi:spore germination protein YaaH/peptidoglycan/xylan/chitin deacetylase (PgdA/CDA1 family)/glycosyltransferase involved in cell wall biosynthesis